VGLRVSKFLGVDKSLLDPATDCYNILYRALDIFFH